MNLIKYLSTKTLIKEHLKAKLTYESLIERRFENYTLNKNALAKLIKETDELMNNYGMELLKRINEEEISSEDFLTIKHKKLKTT